MSLINQMLVDLETRRGGRVESSARALEGLAPVVPPPRGWDRRSLLALPGGVLAAVLAWHGLEAYSTRAGTERRELSLLQQGATAGTSDTAAPRAGYVLPQGAVGDPAAPGDGAARPAPALPAAARADAGAGSAPEARAESDAAFASLVLDGPAGAEPGRAMPGQAVAPPVVDEPTSIASDAAAQVGSESGETGTAAAAETPAPGGADITLARSEGPAAVASDEVEYKGSLRKEPHVAPSDPASALRAIVPRLHGPDQVRALKDLERLVARAPGYLPARQALAAELVRGRQAAAAERVLRAGLAQNPQAPRLAELLAHVLLARGDTVAALAALDGARPAAAADADYLAFAAALEQRLGRHAVAAASYRAALALAPQRGAWWAGLAISLAALERPQEARAAYDRALADRGLSDNLRRYAESARARLPVAG